VVFPTDTVYGVAGHAYLIEAVEQIYHVKERPKDKAIPLLLADSEQVQEVASDVLPVAYRLMGAFWPGGLTIILPKSHRVPDVVTAGGATVALRTPDHPFVLALIRALGAPLAATSANVSGYPPATTAREALDELRGRVALIVDGGMCPGGVRAAISGQQSAVSFLSTATSQHSWNSCIRAIRDQMSFLAENDLPR